MFENNGPETKSLKLNDEQKKENWVNIDGKTMMPDIGTRKGAKISDILENSPWFGGFPWTKTAL